MHAHGGIAQQLLFACLTGMWTALQPGHLLIPYYALHSIKFSLTFPSKFTIFSRTEYHS